MGLYSYVFLYRLRQQHRQFHRNYLQNTQERFVSNFSQAQFIMLISLLYFQQVAFGSIWGRCSTIIRTSLAKIRSSQPTKWLEKLYKE